MKYIILIFETTHKVLKTDKLLIENKIKFDIIPTPKDISSDCGMAIRIDPTLADLFLIKSLLKKNNIECNYIEKQIK